VFTRQYDCVRLGVSLQRRLAHIRANRRADAIVLVYSITSKLSFNNVTRLHQAIITVRQGSPKTPMILVGNKCEEAGRQRQVTALEGNVLARQMGCGFLEVSARTNYHVDDIFDLIVSELRGEQPQLFRTSSLHVRGALAQAMASDCVII
jgi:GTPase SAR1 family protein